MASPTRTLRICKEKQRLSDAIVDASSKLLQLHDDEMAGLLAGRTGDDYGRFDIALRLARIRRDDAKWAFVLHIRTHGC